MKRMRFLLTGAALLAAAAYAQEDFVPEGETSVIYQPAAWTRLKGEYAVNMGVEPFITRGELGVLDYLTVGISYGGAGVFGTGDADMYPRPGFLGKLRLTNGGDWFPAVAVGYDDQGHGRYFDVNPESGADYDRYQFKAKGFFGVISQEIEFLGALGLHAGVSYNFAETKDDGGVDAYGAVEKAVGPYFMFLGTYDAALNDNDEDSLGMGKGYLDAGVRWRVAPEFNVEFWFTNILQNQTDKLGDGGSYARMLYLTYVGSF